MVTTLSLAAAPAYRRENYGVILVSDQVARVAGRGVHNPSHLHQVEVWDNQVDLDRRRREGVTSRPDTLVDPVTGQPTAERYTVLLRPLPSVLTSTPDPRPRPAIVALEVGAVVALEVLGLDLGTFRVVTVPGQDPRLERDQPAAPLGA